MRRPAIEAAFCKLLLRVNAPLKTGKVSKVKCEKDERKEPKYKKGVQHLSGGNNAGHPIRVPCYQSSNTDLN